MKNKFEDKWLVACAAKIKYVFLHTVEINLGQKTFIFS